MKLTTKSQIEKRRPGLKHNSEKMPKFQRPAPITPNPMLQACAFFASFFQSFSCPTENCKRNKNCFEFCRYNFKNCVQPERKTKRKNVPAKNCKPKTKLQYLLLLEF
ncbi:MAG: hypothetical protein HY252_10835 [Sphingobacteriales bacterium]|nr:hypothetical protein [Sphingobacteriales bacterium]